MHVYELTGTALEQVIESLSAGDVHTLHVAVDPIDDAVKFKLNGGTWSPPFGKRVGE